MAQQDKELKSMLTNIATVAKNTRMEDIFSPEDPVIMLDDGDFIAGDKIRDNSWRGPGILMAYAKWCPSCQNKVTDINKLATQKTVYVVDADDNPIFNLSNKIKQYPTYFEILQNGKIGKTILI
jgi:hypothetical protein